MATNPTTPPIRDSGATGVPERDQRDPTRGEADQAPHAPRTSGAPERGKEPLVDAIADRNVEGPREAGATPRPTDKPIVGGDKGSAA